MISIITFNLVLRIGLTGMMDVAFVIHVLGAQPHDATGDPPGLRVPAHVIAYLKQLCHGHSLKAMRDFGRMLFLLNVRFVEM